MSDKHTPGPWNVAGLTITADAGNPEQPIAHIVQFLPKFSHETEANARLIAAAPELLAALVAMVGLVRLKYGNLDADIWGEVVKAEEAIAKARGE